MGNMMFTVGPVPENGERKLPATGLWLSGAWLKDYGFNTGDKLELIRGKNMLILVKAGRGG